MFAEAYGDFRRGWEGRRLNVQLENPADSDEPGAPVPRREAFDANHPAGTRGVDELTGRNRNPDVRGPASDSAEEDQIAWLERIRRNLAARFVLLRNRPRQSQALQAEHVRHEPTAVEP